LETFFICWLSNEKKLNATKARNKRTMQHTRTVLIIFPLIFQAIIIAQMLSTAGGGEFLAHDVYATHMHTAAYAMSRSLSVCHTGIQNGTTNPAGFRQSTEYLSKQILICAVKLQMRVTT